MKKWENLLHFAQSAKNEKEKRKAGRAIRKYLENAAIPELKEIIQTTEDEFIIKQAGNQIWWREFDKKPENLLELIQISNDKEKINIAIDELEKLKYWDAVSTLIGFLGDIDLRDSAAMALRKMPTQEAFEPLVQSIKQYPDGAECLLYALQMLDCSDAAELFVDLFIAKPKAPVVRDDIYVCFAEKTIKCIPKQVKEVCCSKLLRAIENNQDQTDTEELKQLYNLVSQIKKNEV